MFPSLCGLIQFQGEVRKKVLSQLLLLLCHSFPVVGLLGACTAILEAGLLGFFDQQFHPGGKISTPNYCTFSFVYVFCIFIASSKEN